MKTFCIYRCEPKVKTSTDGIYIWWSHRRNKWVIFQSRQSLHGSSWENLYGLPNGHELACIKRISLKKVIKLCKFPSEIGRFQKMVVVLSGLSLLGMSLENVNLSYALPYAKCDLQLTTAEQGILTSVSFLGIVSTSYFWGFLVDTWGRKRVICTAACCGFFCSFLSDFSMNTITLIVLRFLAGALWVEFQFFRLFICHKLFFLIFKLRSLSGIQAGSLSYVSEFHSSKTATRAVAFTSSFMNGMSLLMAPLAMVIMPMDWTWQIYMLNYRPWRLFLLINSLLNLWNGIVFFLLPESPKFLLSINEHEKALQVLRRVYAFNTGQSPEVCMCLRCNLFM